MSQSPTALRYRGALLAVRDLLRTEMKPAKADGWLAAALECRVGLHAEERRYKATGLYVLPDADNISEAETNQIESQFRVKIIMSARSLTGDTSDDDPATFVLTDLVGGVIDLLNRNRDQDGGWVVLSGDMVAEQVAFEVAMTESSFYYRAAVPATLHFEAQP